jgi:hypothetical protein
MQKTLTYRNAFKGMHCNTEYEKELHFKKLIKLIKATRVQISPYEGKKTKCFICVTCCTERACVKLNDVGEIMDVTGSCSKKGIQPTRFCSHVVDGRNKISYKIQRKARTTCDEILPC